LEAGAFLQLMRWSSSSQIRLNGPIKVGHQLLKELLKKLPDTFFALAAALSKRIQTKRSKCIYSSNTLAIKSFSPLK